MKLDLSWRSILSVWFASLPKYLQSFYQLRRFVVLVSAIELRNNEIPLSQHKHSIQVFANYAETESTNKITWFCESFEAIEFEKVVNFQQILCFSPEPIKPKRLFEICHE